jgi:hypothetical protein
LFPDAAALTQCVKSATENCLYLTEALYTLANATTISAGMAFDSIAQLDLNLTNGVQACNCVTMC